MLNFTRICHRWVFVIHENYSCSQQYFHIYFTHHSHIKILSRSKIVNLANNVFDNNKQTKQKMTQTLCKTTFRYIILFKHHFQESDD